MFKLLVILAVCSSALALRRPRLDGRIVGGETVDIKDFPHQLSLQSYGSHICGASIIGKNWVLTASHCVDGAYEEEISFRAGSSTRGKGGTVHQAKKITMHPKYNGNTIDFDYAVVEVETPFPVGNEGVRAIEMASEEPSAGTPAVVSGWGTTSSGGSLPKQLQAVQVPIVSRDACEEAYGDITQRMICAGYQEGGKDSCQGDSGGPLVNKNTGEQIGVVSWGYGCAEADYPGVYANVAVGRSWINEVTGI